MSLKRIMFEYRKAKKDDLKEILDVSLKDPADYTEWICTIQGPIGTPYEDGIFILNCKFPDNYPFEPPKIVFETKIMHPNISSKGTLCSHCISNLWSPALQ